MSKQRKFVPPPRGAEVIQAMDEMPYVGTPMPKRFECISCGVELDPDDFENEEYADICGYCFAAEMTRCREFVQDGYVMLAAETSLLMTHSSEDKRVYRRLFDLILRVGAL